MYIYKSAQKIFCTYNKEDSMKDETYQTVVQGVRIPIKKMKKIDALVNKINKNKDDRIMTRNKLINYAITEYLIANK